MERTSSDLVKSGKAPGWCVTKAMTLAQELSKISVGDKTLLDVSEEDEETETHNQIPDIHCPEGQIAVAAFDSHGQRIGGYVTAPEGDVLKDFPWIDQSQSQDSPDSSLDDRILTEEEEGGDWDEDE